MNIGDTIVYHRSDRTRREGVVTRVGEARVWATFNGEDREPTNVQISEVEEVRKQNAWKGNAQ